MGGSQQRRWALLALERNLLHHNPWYKNCHFGLYMWSLSGPVCSSITSHRFFCHEAELLCQQTWAVTLNQWYIHLGLWISKFREHWNPWEGLWKYRALGATLRICLVWGMYNSNQSPRAAHAGLHFDNHWPKKIPCLTPLGRQPAASPKPGLPFLLFKLQQSAYPPSNPPCRKESSYECI